VRARAAGARGAYFDRIDSRARGGCHRRAEAGRLAAPDALAATRRHDGER